MLKKSFLITVLLLMVAFVAFATIPKKINYQGFLTHSDGTPVTTTTTTPLLITFSIYNTETTTTFLWQATYEVHVTEGRFNKVLGEPDHLGVPKEIPYPVFDGSIKYLGIKIGTDPEMSPRKKLTSVAYSYKAHDAQQLGGKEPSEFIQKVNNVLPNTVGNIDLVAGSNVSILPDPAAHTVTISATPGGTGGDITAVNAGNGMTGGATTGDATLHVGEGTGLSVGADAVSLNTAYTDGRYYQKNQLNTNDGNVNQTSDPVSWYKIKDMPAGFADGNDNSGGGGGDITGVKAGNGLTGGGTSGDVELHVGAGTGITIGANTVALSTSYTDGRYVNEGQSNSITSAMITNNTITDNDISSSADLSVGSVRGNFGVMAGSVTPSALGNVTASNDVEAKDNLIAGDDLIVKDHAGINRTSVSTTYQLYVNGSAHATGTWHTSDLKLKNNISDIESPLDKVMNIKGASYRFKTQEYADRCLPEGRQYGLIAQEVEKIIPEVVKTDENGEKAINYSAIIPLLVEAIKQQQKMIEELQNQIKNK